MSEPCMQDVAATVLQSEIVASRMRRRAEGQATVTLSADELLAVADRLDALARIGRAHHETLLEMLLERARDARGYVADPAIGSPEDLVL